jgi:membrane-bound metal-dependent hydrolase YbcI (DUF457 family)
MDNLTHSLFALTLARTSLGRNVRGRTAVLLLASNAPDIDIVSIAGGSAGYLQWHRSLTHAPLGIVGLGLVTAGIVHAVLRFRDRDRGHAAASFTALAGLAMLGALLHVLMDLPTSYGTRLLSPFDWHWFTTDSIPIVDIYLLAALAAGLYWGRSSDEARRRNAAIVLSLMMANYGVRVVAHHRALTLAPRLFGPTWPERCPDATPQGPLVDRWPRVASSPQPAPGDARCLIEVAAMPSLISPFEWRVIAETSDGYDLQDVNVLDSRFWTSPRQPEVLWRHSTRYPNRWPPEAIEAASAPTARIFLGFARFPAVQPFRDRNGGVTVQFADVRFVGDGPPGPARPRGEGTGPNARGLFGATVRFSPDGKLVEDRLGP